MNRIGRHRRSVASAFLTIFLFMGLSVEPDLGIAWGLGWGIERDVGDVLIWHWGDNPGFRAFVMGSIKSGDGVVVLTNSAGGLSVAEPIVDLVLPGRHTAFKSYVLRDGLDRWLCKTILAASRRAPGQWRSPPGAEKSTSAAAAVPFVRPG